MNATKAKKSGFAIGRKRGVPMRLVRAIARRYDLDKIVVWTGDKAAGQSRELILCYGRSNSTALQASTFANAIAAAAGWSKDNAEIELSFVRRLKGRIKELETALAQIVDGCPDPAGLARAVGKFPDESEGEKNLGEWIFYPQGKLSREAREQAEKSAGILSSEQLAADTVRELAFRTAQKISLMFYANLTGEIETAMREAVRKFGGRRRKE